MDDSRVEPRVLTPEQLCERWAHAVTPRTLRLWRSAGRGPRPTRIGKAVVYMIEDVEEFERISRSEGGKER